MVTTIERYHCIINVLCKLVNTVGVGVYLNCAVLMNLQTLDSLFFFLFFSRATDQQYGIRTFEDNSKLHGHTNEHVQLIRRGTSRD